MEKKSIMSWVLCLCFILFCADWVCAVPVTIEISGVVTSTNGNGLPNMVQVGDSFTGYYTYDTSTSDLNAKENRGDYQHTSPYSFCVYLGGYEFKASADKGFEIRIWDDFTNPLGDTFDWYYVESLGVEPVAGIEGIFLTWRLEDSTHNSLSSEDLTAEAPILSDWNSNWLQIGSQDGYSTFFHIKGRVTEAVVIPEPATLALLGVGGLMLRKRKR